MTSANVVGYQNKDVLDGFSCQMCTFDGIQGGGLDLKTFVPKDSEGETLGDGEATIQFLNKFGVAESSCAYYFAKTLSKYQLTDGWYNEEDEETPIEDVFDPGEGLMIYAAGDLVFPYAGQVNMAETDVPVADGFQAFGNIRPTTVDIQELIPVDDDGETLGDGEITIQFLNKFGVAESSCSYYFAKTLSKYQLTDGWYDEEDEENPIEKEFAAGEGFMIYAAGDGNVRFPEL